VTRESQAGPLDGERVVFRTQVPGFGVELTKTFTLYKGEDGFDLSLEFKSPEQTRALVYRLLGPHGIPIEGEWYTGTFRDAVFGLGEGSSSDLKVVTISAYDVAKRKGDPERLTKPLRFGGVENQYFTSFLAPVPAPQTEAERYDAETSPMVLHDDPENRQKSDISVALLSKPITVGPNLPVTHTYKVFAGPKTVDALRPYAAEQLAAYRKSNLIPFASFFAQTVISPLLDTMYDLTKSVSRLLGGTRGNYGIAIILLTMLVRLAMFPLGRKQALVAKKMQDLQPYMKEIQEKYKDDKEAQTKETFALYKRHGVNPVSGCLPALIQLPIFVGLWQALNNSVHLRHARFLYIENLAAPDMLFRFPVEVPFLGNYFNLLPFLVVALMLIQTKLFSPPATTPEAEMQQKMMKYMMVFMAFMFYKVPSGLGIYFITSSLWQVSERLLLPKVTAAPPAASGDGGRLPPSSGTSGSGGGGRGTDGAPAKPRGRISQFWEKVLEEAAKDPTYRKLTDGSSKERDRGKPRARPGRRR
jgi:YidC/Oxa1 family membrane protein insertase